MYMVYIHGVYMYMVYMVIMLLTLLLKGLRHSVKPDQRKGGALKQGLLLESFHSNLSAPGT